MKKILITFFILLAVAALICVFSAIAFLIKWNQCAETASAPVIVETVFPDTEKTIAQKIPCEFLVETSWSLMPVSAEMTPPAGAQEGKDPEIIPGKWHWGTRMWKIILWIQPYRSGTIGETPVKLLFEGGPDGKYLLETKIPSFDVKIISSQQEELFLSDKVPVPGKNPGNWFWFLFGGVVFAALLLWLIFRKRTAQPKPGIPVWKQALDSIAALKADFRDKKTSSEQAVIRLTDIVRAFLEQQFSLRAERQTTHEFLESLRNNSSVLDLEQRRFLQEFLSAADMIKFAKLPAEESLFEQAASRAEALIRNTTQPSEEKESHK